MRKVSARRAVGVEKRRLSLEAAMTGKKRENSGCDEIEENNERDIINERRASWVNAQKWQ